jgi:predicted Zn-dependent peptidase
MRPITLPRVQSFTLDNGMKVTLVPFGDVPRAEVSLVVRAGKVNTDEKTRDVPALTALLLKEGTESRDAAALARAVAALGGALATSVDRLVFTIESPVLAEKTPELVRLVAEVAVHPALPASELARLQTDHVRAVAVAKSQAQVQAFEVFRALLFPHHPYGWRYPTPEEIKGYTIEDVRSFWKGQAGAARAHLYVVGRFDAGAVEAAARQAFAGWAAGPAPATPPVKPVAAHTIHLIDRPGAVQSSIRLGLPAIDPAHPDSIPLQVTNMLLGGSFASRITANIREAKGYTYAPYSSVQRYLGAGAWSEQADIKSDVTGAALAEILKEIRRLAATPPPAAELQAIQRYMTGAFVLEMATISGILAQLQLVDLFGLPDDYLAKYVERVQAVTPADVQRMTRTYLDPGKMALVVVGDKAAMKKQLGKFGKIVEEPAAH